MSTPSISQPEHTLSIAACVVWNDVEGDLVLFNSDDGAYHALNEVASHVWRSIAAGHAVRDILLDLHQAYQHDPTAIDEAVGHFIRLALDQGLLLSHSGAR